MLKLTTSDLNGLSNWLGVLHLIDSRTSSDRLIKAGAVEINGQKMALEKFWLLHFDDGDAILLYPSMTWINGPWTIRVGKKWLRVV